MEQITRQKEKNEEKRETTYKNGLGQWGQKAAAGQEVEGVHVCDFQMKLPRHSPVACC